MRLMIFSHVAFSCADPARTEAFYRTHFGFHRARVIGEGDDQVVFLKMESCSVMLELFRAKGASPEPAATGAGPEFPGYRHIAFQVDDVEAILAEMGPEARLTLGPADFGDVIPGWKTAWIADPDGRIVEISQGYRDAHPDDCSS